MINNKYTTKKQKKNKNERTRNNKNNKHTCNKIYIRVFHFIVIPFLCLHSHSFIHFFLRLSNGTRPAQRANIHIYNMLYICYIYIYPTIWYICQWEGHKVFAQMSSHICRQSHRIATFLLWGGGRNKSAQIKSSKQARVIIKLPVATPCPSAYTTGYENIYVCICVLQASYSFVLHMSKQREAEKKRQHLRHYSGYTASWIVPKATIYIGITLYIIFFSLQ